MSFSVIALLSIIQGLAELLPVSSSAHVILAAKLLGLDPSTADMVFLLVMLHTGTMFAVILYFWSRWKAVLFHSDKNQRWNFIKNAAVATAATGVVGLSLKYVIEKVFMSGADKQEIEQLFKVLPLVGAALAAAGILIIVAGRRAAVLTPAPEINLRRAAWIGAVQGVCLPFRGFSRSGATISTSLLLGVPREEAESFSFALAVILTPPVIVHSLKKLRELHGEGLNVDHFAPGALGLVLSFAAGLVALRFLSSMLEKGRWSYFGFYCLALAAITFGVHFFF